jgi:hypothetical protein
VPSGWSATTASASVHASDRLRLVGAAERTTGRYSYLLRQNVPAAAEDTTRHRPVTERLAQVIARGQRSGEFDDTLPTAWLVSVVLAIGHTLPDPGSMSEAETSRARHTTLLRALGHQPPW